MGAASTSLARLKGITTRTGHGIRNRLSCSMASNNSHATKILLFADCTNPFGLQCAISLLKSATNVYRIHATVSDFDNKEFLGDDLILQHLNRDLFVHKIDLLNEDSVDEVVTAILTMEGKIDVLVCNIDAQMAGVVGSQTLEQITSTFDRNYFPHANLIKGVLPQLKKQGSGNVIVINTIAGMQGIPCYSIYCAARFAIEGMLEALASECAMLNIQFSTIEIPLRETEESDISALDMIVELRVEGYSSTESDNMEACEEIERRLKEHGLMDKIKATKIADIIRHIVTSETAYFRYYGNRTCSSAMKEKLIDYRGLQTQIEVTKFFLNSDLEEIRPTPKMSRRRNPSIDLLF